MAGSYVFYVQTLPSADEFAVLVQPGAGEVRAPVSEAERPEFGIYRTNLPSDRFERLVREIEGAGPAPLETGEDSPGALVATLGIMDEGGSRVIHGFRAGRPPASLVPALETLREVQEEIRVHPWRVLRGEFAWARDPFPVGEDLRGEITLTASGTEPVTVRAPTAGPGEEPPQVALLLYRTERRGGRRLHREVTFRPGDVRPRGTESGPPPEGGEVTLAPGASVVYCFGTEVRLGPGTYPAALRYVSRPFAEEPEGFLAGTLQLSPAPLHVAK